MLLPSLTCNFLSSDLLTLYRKTFAWSRKQVVYRFHRMAMWLSLISLWNCFIVQNIQKMEIIFYFNVNVLSFLHTQYTRMISVWFSLYCFSCHCFTNFEEIHSLQRVFFLSAFRNNNFSVTAFKRNLKLPLSNYVFFFIKCITRIHLLYEEFDLLLICEIHRVVLP